MITSHEQLQAHPQIEKRAHARNRVKLALRFSNFKSFTNTPARHALLVDLSLGGARIESSTPLTVDDWVEGRPNSLSRLDPRTRSLVKHRWHPHAKVVWEKIETRSPAPGESPVDRETTVYVYGLKFIRARVESLKFRLFTLIPQLALVFLMLGTANVFYLKWFNVYYFWYSPVLNSYSLIISIYILSRFLFAIFYRPPRDQGYVPSVSVIIACKNEEASIRRTIDCVYEADYPKDQLEVIVVNDGSTDGTLSEMLQAGEDHQSLRIVNFKKNLGKRHGMAIGAKMATGEILVYIDSDSFIRRDGLYQIVQGFADPSVGAVCGHANVTNAGKNLLTKMQEVRYFVAFRIVKAAESLFSTVSCCSGCFAAYRRDYVMPILSTWLNQKFLGIPATFGDDRSLTNFMLRKYRVIYHSEAVCTTLVPESYRVFFRQQLRWKKSWVRESLLACTFMWKRHPVAAFFFYCGVLFPIVAPLIVLNAVVLPLLGFWPLSYLYLYGATLMAALYSGVYLAYHRNGLWVYGISFSLFYMLILVWQTYYAILTVKQNHWGTR